MAPSKRQTLLFSATLTNEVKKLAALSLRKPVRLAADTVGLAPKLLRQEIVRLKVCTTTFSCASRRYFNSVTLVLF